MRKPPQDWQRTFKQQQESGLTIKAFCQKNKITISTFYKYKQFAKQPSQFVQAKVVAPATEQVIGACKPVQVIILDTPIGKLTFSESISPQFLIQLMRGLS